MNTCMPHDGNTHMLENGQIVQIVPTSKYHSTSAADARRLLVLEAFTNKRYENKSLAELKCSANTTIACRSVEPLGDETQAYMVFDVAEMWAAFNPTQFQNSSHHLFNFRRVLMTDDQRDFMKCKFLHGYQSLEFRQNDCERYMNGRACGATYKPMLNAEDMLHFFTSAFFDSSLPQPNGGQQANVRGNYKLCMFQEEIQSTPPPPPQPALAPALVRASAPLLSAPPQPKLEPPGAVRQQMLRCSQPQTAFQLGMQTFNTTRTLVREMRDLHAREDVEQEFKRRRLHMVQTEIKENLLNVMLTANMELCESLFKE